MYIYIYIFDDWRVSPIWTRSLQYIQTLTRTRLPTAASNNPTALTCHWQMRAIPCRTRGNIFTWLAQMVLYNIYIIFHTLFISSFTFCFYNISLFISSFPFFLYHLSRSFYIIFHVLICLQYCRSCNVWSISCPATSRLPFTLNPPGHNLLIFCGKKASAVAFKMTHTHIRLKKCRP